MLALLAVALHGSLSVGVGSAYDYVGARAEVRLGQVALSAALGESGLFLIDPPHNETPHRDVDTFPALGLRAFSGDGRGAVLALHWTSHGYARNYDSRCCFDRTAHLDTLTLTAGYRHLFGSGVYFEALAGAGAAILRGHPSVSGHDSTPGPFRRDVSLIPDLVVGVGFEL